MYHKISSLRQLSFLDKREMHRLQPIISPYVGIVNVLAQRDELQKFGLHIYQTLSAQARILFNLEREASTGGMGIDTVEKGAFMAAVGETIERYCMSYYDKNLMLYTRWSELPIKPNLGHLMVHSDAQYKRHHLKNPQTEKIYWTKVTSVFSDDSLYWPSSWIFIPFPRTEQISESTSTGMASHPDKKKALLSGILEVLERDALMINFYQQLHPPIIDLNSIGDAELPLAKQVRRSYNVRIYQLYTDHGVPTFFGLIWRRCKDGFHYGIGASSSLSSTQAINKTLKECLFTYFYSKFLLHLKVQKKDSINALYEHFLYYQGKRFSDLLSDGPIIPYSPVKLSSDQLRLKLRENNLIPYYVDLTTPDIATTRIKVMRVVIPGCVDLSKTYGLERKNTERFWSVPKKLGFATTSYLYHEPHPFP